MLIFNLDKHYCDYITSIIDENIKIQIWSNAGMILKAKKPEIHKNTYPSAILSTKNNTSVLEDVYMWVLTAHC
jgi:hypothetical protein